MTTNSTVQYLFNAPDGAPLIAQYNRKGAVIVYCVGKETKFDITLMEQQCPDLVKRVRDGLAELAPWPGGII